MIGPRPDADNIYVSPHLDDVAFSLGAFVAKGDGGTLVNIFTQSLYLATGSPDVSTEAIDRISAIRDAEDRAFADKFGLTRISLGADEPKLRGREPFGSEGVEDDVAQIRDILSATLSRLTSSPIAHQVFCPVGIGRHVNHLATRQVVMDWSVSAPPRTTIYFYEDLHYASRWLKRIAGLKSLRLAAGPNRLVRHWWPSDERKLDQINLYASQHLHPVTDLREYSPATLWQGRPHEAAWELIRSR